MKQTRATSLLKSTVSTAVGFAVALGANALVLPWFGLSPSLSQNLVLTTIYTAISIARGYALERLFEALGWRARMSAFALAVLAERQRQMTGEGWTPEHDDEHPAGELARAGAAYALYAGLPTSEPPSFWPWSGEWWRPAGFRRDLVKAAALILAEGERFERNRHLKSTTDVPPPAGLSRLSRGDL